MITMGKEHDMSTDSWTPQSKNPVGSLASNVASVGSVGAEGVSILLWC